MSRAEPAEFVVDRQVWTSYRPFLVLGSVGVVLGGLLAAVTGPLALPMGSWAAEPPQVRCRSCLSPGG